MEKKNITVAGAGLVGSLLSIYLAKKGHDVTIYERRPDMRKADISAGRSINLALSDRGWKALAGAGIGDEIKEVAIPMHKRVMHAVDGTLTDQAYGNEGQAIYSVSRGGLNALLMDLAEKHGVNIKFDKRCTSVNMDEAIASFKDYQTDEKETVDSNLIIGADGAFSAVRNTMQRTDRFNYSQEYIEHGYKELTIPANADGTHKLEKNALHIWPRGEFMLIALPNMDGSFTCTLFFPFEGKDSFSTIKTEEDVLEFFNRTFPDAVPLMPTLVDDYFGNPTSSLVIIRCYPWAHQDKVCLVGDASHAIVPFYGQGMNSGFEDCTIFGEMMDKHGDDWTTLLDEFQKERKPNADAIADLAMRNFVEMRDLTADPAFLLQKKIEKRFANKYPGKWMPLYSMVTFSHIPYAEANAAGNKQDQIMEQVMAMPNIADKWDSQEVEDKILSLL